MRIVLIPTILALCCASCVAGGPPASPATSSFPAKDAQLRALDARAHDYALNAGLPSIRRGEVRVWISSVNTLEGFTLIGSEVIRHVFSYATSERRSKKVEMHKNAIWIRSAPSSDVLQQIRDAASDVDDLHGMNIPCNFVLDGYRVLIDAMVDGTRLLLQANDPDECMNSNDASGRISALATLMRSAASPRM